jgi:anaerobic selenocysteine-containing dehydrogenase
LRTIVAVPAPKPVGIFTVAVVRGAAPLAFALCEPLLKTIEYVKPTPATSLTYKPPPLTDVAATGTASVKPDGYRLRLVTSRTLYDGGTLVANSPHLAPLAPRRALHCNPSDVTRFSLVDGAEVKVASTRSSTTLAIVADPRVPKGACWIPWNVGTPAAGDLIDSTLDVCDLSVEMA